MRFFSRQNAAFQKNLICLHFFCDDCLKDWISRVLLTQEVLGWLCMLSSVVIWEAGLQGDLKVCALHSKLKRPENSPLGFSIFIPFSFLLMAYAAGCPKVSDGWHLEPLVRACYLLVTRVILSIFFSETHCPYVPYI